MRKVSNDPVGEIADSICEVYLPVFKEMKKQAETDEAKKANGIIAEAWIDGAHSVAFFLLFSLVGEKVLTEEDRPSFYQQMTKSFEHFRVEKMFELMDQDGQS